MRCRGRCHCRCKPERLAGIRLVGEPTPDEIVPTGWVRLDLDPEVEIYEATRGPHRCRAIAHGAGWALVRCPAGAERGWRFVRTPEGAIREWPTLIEACAFATLSYAAPEARS